MPLTVWLAALAVAASIPLAWWAVSGGRLPARAVRANLGQGLGRSMDLREIQLQSSARDRVVTPSMQLLARRARRITPSGIVDRLEQRIMLAGVGDRWPIERALATKMTLGIIGATLGALLFAVQPSLIRLLCWAVFTLGGYFAIDAILDRRARDRQAQIGRALPEMLDQITICVESGLGFEAAVARAAKADGPLARELGRTLQDVQMGLARTRALEQLLERTDVRELRSFVHAFAQAERYGIPIAQVLRVQADEMRDKRRQQAEERATKMPVILVFPVVLCILPAMLVVIAGPAVVRISQTSFWG
ncbi:MAG: type II secretion system F family protein [Actinobacteria bacterium]|nr:type II secretion system F family protein [Actinomycetota bacterium]